MGSKPFDANDDEDTKAILTRRALLIRASLAGAGLFVGTAEACACLDTAMPQVCLSDTQVCLTDIRITYPDAQDAMDDAPPDAPEAPDGPQVCLSPRAPDVEPG